MKSFLFPFHSEKYKFLERKWRHRLLKMLFFLIIWCWLILSFITYTNSDINTIIGPSYNFKWWRWINQAFQDTINQIPQEDFDVKYYSLNEEMKNVFMDLRTDINNVKNEGRKINMSKLKNLYPELFEAKFGFFYYIWYYFQIILYTVITTYVLSIILQLIYFKWIIYIVYWDKKNAISKKGNI